MANGDQLQVSHFLILRTFSTVKPKKMAVFMNAITWQAAWLRHHFQWERAVVGYALTDVPERVLEIYGIPTGDIERAESILKKLRAQDEYQELKECCEGGREDDEMLFPAMQYKTFLRGFMEQHMKELGLNARRREIQKDREVNRALLAEFNALRARLANAETELAGARGRLSGLSAAQASAAAARESDSQAVSRLEQQVDSFRKSLARLPPQPTLTARENEFGRQLGQVEKDLQSAQEIKRGLKSIPVPDYFLTVSIKLKQGMLPEYVQQMTLLLEEFAWDFMAAGEKLPPPGILENRSLPVPEIMHLWRFGDANDLYRQMVGLRESRRYSAITQLLSEPERQMLMCDWEAISRTKKSTSIFRSEGKEE
ncbi:hypothetical protein JRI60_48835 [Archangium violaceum]|uniref:hypothetical protein n=1 Tax=Archangium violaceum TaxID=83451 RepID=UPI001951AE21|nr:hypothetical protein [Archangium violaceum]QRN96805.1 hypothetical protein JRI60_48835 [Archangium violaceum]